MERIKKAKRINLIVHITALLFCIILVFYGYKTVWEDPKLKEFSWVFIINSLSVKGYFGIICCILSYRVVDMLILIPETMLVKMSNDEYLKSYLLHGQEISEEESNIISKKALSKTQVEMEILEEALKQEEKFKKQ
ncbi:MAG: hypothetical protein J5563_04695 [Clostridia bacterium]|nr:hypothetical protein [Clostridia bacterium]